MDPGSTSRRPALEVGAVVLTALLQFVFYDLLPGRGIFLLTVVIAWVAYVVTSIRRRPEALRELGLAIRCPRTGLPAILIGHSGGVPGVGRFHFEVVEPGGLPRRTLSSAVLPPLQLRPDDLARGQHVARPDRSR